MAIRVPVAQPRTRPSGEKLGYFEAAPVDTRGLERGAQNLAGSIYEYRQAKQASEEARQAELDRETERTEEIADAANQKIQRFDTLRKFSDFQTSTAEALNELQKGYSPTDPNYPRKVQEVFDKSEANFLSNVPPELQDEFSLRTNEIRSGVINSNNEFMSKARATFFERGIDKHFNDIKTQFAQDPNDTNFAVAFDSYEELVDTADIPQLMKDELKLQGRKELEAISYQNKQTKKQYNQIITGTAPKDVQDSIVKAAVELGVDPIDLATVIAYETAGTFSTSIKGGKSGKYMGLIQFGEEERVKYGAVAGQTFPEQMKAVVRYLKDRGFKSGMSLTDLYSTINAGTPGRPNASDGNNTVTGHVTEMSGRHRELAQKFLANAETNDPLMTDPMYEHLSYEDKLRITADASKAADSAYTEQEKMRKAQEEASNNELNVGLFEGLYGLQEIEDRINAGGLTDYDARKKAYDIYNTKNAAAITARDFSQKLNGQMFLDPTSSEDNKQFDAWVGDEGLQRLNAMDQEYINNILGPVIRKVGVIPNSVIGGLTAMARSNDPKKQGFALNTLAQFEDWEPAAYEKVSATVQSDVNYWRNWKDILPQDELFREINGGIDSAQRQAKRIYRDEADKIFTDAKNPDFVSLPDVVGEFDTFLSAAPQTANVWFAARGVMVDFQETFRHEYVRNNGDIAKAKDSAFKQLKSRWTVSSLGGQSTLMRNPPEKHIPTVLGSFDWATEQARNDLGLLPEQKFQLISDENTQQEIDKKENPSWLVVIQDQTGNWREFRNTAGVLQRLSFQISEEQKNLNVLDQTIQELRTNLTHFNLGGENVLDATDERRSAIRAQRKSMQLRLQELEADFNKRMPKPSRQIGARGRGTERHPSGIFNAAP